MCLHFFCSRALISSSTIERKGTYALKCTQTKRKLLILSYYISGQHHIVVIDNDPSQQEHFGYKVELLNYGNNLNHNYDEDYLSQKINLKWSAFVKRFSLTEKVPHCKGKAKWKHHFKHLLEVLIVSEYQFVNCTVIALCDISESENGVCMLSPITCQIFPIR